ncbi:MAG: HAMP domain-containing histidine kinase [Candidatus Niyogibacteria bacterium]|nr:HAMP domain-containing histidine kinase [Candidatus Niyogibacteria bacterium]
MSIWSELNVYKKCHEYQVSLWSCPQFLFIVMGAVIIVAILGTNAAAQRYTEPEISALIVIGVTIFLLFIGHAIINSFERVAEEVRAKTEFISIVSHELRNPLTSVGWQLDLLAKHKATGEAAEVMAAIRTEADKMLDLVNDMLLANRMEVHAFELKPEPFSLPDLAREVVKEYELTAKKTGATIAMSIDDGLPAVYGDVRKIKMVIEHLVDNALKYGKNSQEVVVRVARRGAEIFLGVTDQGVGIPASDQKYIFGKFFRAHNAQRYQIEGIGLGLYIVRNTVEKSGGRLGFESKEGEGSTFWFSLPACEGEFVCK